MRVCVCVCVCVFFYTFSNLQCPRILIFYTFILIARAPSRLDKIEILFLLHVG